VIHILEGVVILRMINTIAVTIQNHSVYEHFAQFTFFVLVFRLYYHL